MPCWKCLAEHERRTRAAAESARPVRIYEPWAGAVNGRGECPGHQYRCHCAACVDDIVFKRTKLDPDTAALVRVRQGGLYWIDPDHLPAHIARVLREGVK